MAKLIYGSKVDVELDERSAFHLDVLLAQLLVRGAAFQLHVPLAKARDGNLLALTVGPGVELAIEYANDPDVAVIDSDALAEAMGRVLRLGVLSLPFAFESDDSEIDDS